MDDNLGRGKTEKTIIVDETAGDSTLFMVVYLCKKCGELNYLTPHAFWNIADFGAKCE